MPGTLPVINSRAVEYAVRVALALNCSLQERSLFARKNYFYPDLPKGYQISQYELPLATGGWLTVETESRSRRIGIRRVHLEEDTGKLIHRDGFSLVDYNRCGVPLLEIVTEPDLRSVEEAKAYATSLRSMLRYLDVNSGDMEKGVIRFEANISLRLQGTDSLGVRTEIKNLNSFRAMLRALEFEIDRQERILRAGGQVVQETVGWDDLRGVTVSQRSKEEAHDYRYFPDPDLPPLRIRPEWAEAIRSTLPELPDAKRSRYVTSLGLSPQSAATLTSDPDAASFFEQAIAIAPDAPAQTLAHWVAGDFFALLNQSGTDIRHSKVTPQAMAVLVSMVERGEISGPTGKTVLSLLSEQGGEPRELVTRLNLTQLSDKGEIEQIVGEVLQSYPDQVHQYRAGKRTILEWLFGQVMRRTAGRANPAVVRSTLEAGLQSSKGADQDFP
jgi:aspartyl-tRNA(Asn)/glutamyl-tRNA(Gln) amidotransferase subunit B